MLLPTTTDGVRAHLFELFADDLHAKRVASLASATSGLLKATTLGIHAIGRALASADELDPKHAIKQVDRLLSNAGIDPWELSARLVPYLVSMKAEIVVAMDWTDFNADDQATCSLHLVTSHGRATPLLWKTVRKSSLRGKRNRIEDQLLVRLKEVVPPGVRITVLADRGFADKALFEFLSALRIGYVIRIKAGTLVTDAKGTTQSASAWLGSAGRTKKLAGAAVTQDQVTVGAVVVTRPKTVKEPWCLVASEPAATAQEVVQLYAQRMKIEQGYRDIKNLRFGMGLSATRIGDPARRDRMLLVCALGIVLLTLLGAAGESVGLERRLKANTVKTRSYSLFRQGMHYYEWLPGMRAEWAVPLLEKFALLLLEQRVVFDTFSAL
jgi:hypothetical protein